MQQTMSLRRRFSALQGLQAPRTMEYSLKEEKAGQFRLCFLEQAPGRAKQVGNAAFPVSGCDRRRLGDVEREAREFG